MRVLIVEDERLISLVLARMIEALGHKITGRVPSGEAAIAALEAELEPPDLVIMDIHLEGAMDGIEAATRIRQRWNIPLAYASAYSDQVTLDRAAGTAPLAFLQKPIYPAKLTLVFEALAKI